VTGGPESGSPPADGFVQPRRHLRWRKARELEADPDLLVERCLSGTNRSLIEHKGALVEYCQGGTFTGSLLETRKKNAKEVKSFNYAHSIPSPGVKINAVDSPQTVSTVITASKFLHFSNLVLLKVRLTAKARAVILVMLQCNLHWFNVRIVGLESVLLSDFRST
jgi:hypothetical protein